MVDYRKFLGQKDRLVLPYFRGSRVEGDRGDFRITDPLEPGFYLFEIRGRTAHRLERVEAPDLSRLTRVRGHVFDRWIVRDSAITEPLHFLPEDEILRFSPLTARRWYSGDLIFESVDFEDDAEEIARRRYADGDSLAGATGVPATLRAAFGYAVVARESRRLAIPFLPIEVRSRILETAQEGNEHAAAHLIGLRRLREAHRRYRGPRRPMVEPRIDVDEARVTAALSDAGARLCDLRRLEGDLLEVTYDFLGARLTTLVRLDSLRVVDAGICLEGADSELTLASLPGVVREAMDTNQLVVTWHEG